MKKITLLITLMFFSLGFSQELVTNGDFQTGMAAPWTGNAANVVDLGGGEFVNQANVMGAGTPFSVNLSQEVILTSGLSYELTYEAFTDSATGSRTMVVGLGQAAAPFSAVVETVTLTDTPQTFTSTITINYGDAVADRVIFDMGAATGFVFIDNVSVVETVDLCNDGTMNNGETEIDCGGPNCDACPAPPMVAAPTPPALAADDVVSIYSDAYAEIPGINFDAGFCGPGAVTEITPGGNPAFAYNAQACQGIDFDTNQQDTSGLQDGSGTVNFHVDLFIEAGTDLVGKVFNVLLVNPSGDTPVNIDINALSPAPVPGTWYSFDRTITLNDPILRQVTVVSNLNNSVWYDNLYVFEAAALSTDDFAINNFNVSPNPTNNNWNLEANTLVESIEVFDLLGKNVISLTPNSQNVAIDASSLNTGIYLARITANGSTRSLKLIKN